MIPTFTLLSLHFLGSFSNNFVTSFTYPCSNAFIFYFFHFLSFFLICLFALFTLPFLHTLYHDILLRIPHIPPPLYFLPTLSYVSLSLSSDFHLLHISRISISFIPFLHFLYPLSLTSYIHHETSLHIHHKPLALVFF